MIGSMATFVVLASLGQKTNTFSYDFRNAKFDEVNFQYVTMDTPKYLTPEAAGLRINVPAGVEKIMGFFVQTPIVGEFEGTLSYEILSGGRGDKTWGPAVSINIKFNNPLNDGLTFLRQFRGDGDYFTVVHMIDDDVPADKEPKRKQRAFRGVPANKDVLTGKLRVARQGTDFVAQYAEGGGAFQELGRFPIGAGDPQYFRIVADPALKRPIDLRLVDLEIKSSGGNGGAVASPTPSRNRLFWAGIVLIVLLLLLGGGVALWRKKA
jgi:hypothetical protein